MNKILPILLVLCFTSIKLSSQITLSPELGISYLPYKLINNNSEVEQKKLDFLIGIAGSVPVSPTLFFQSRIEFILRQKANYKGSDQGFNPNYQGYSYHNNELNITINGFFKVKRSSIGIGGGFIQDLRSQVVANYSNRSIIEDSKGRFLPFGNISLQYEISPILLRITLNRLLRDDPLDSLHIRSKEGSNDLRFSIGYILGSRD